VCTKFALVLCLVSGTGSHLGSGDDDEEFDRKRYRAKSGFGLLKGDLNHTLTFGGDWHVATKAAFQLASGPLISYEQFAAGGA
ncbi:ShlB/FhaC/HecB family hemolysin secretion/activation protein, partial [Pseudomonas aeruginosa]